MESFNMNTAILAISGISIKQDSFGRFCLNDLHKAAGGEKRHSPNYWLAIQQTKELIEEFVKSTTDITVVEQNQPVNVINGGVGRGTYAAKELVYAYATWISAKFFLTVIRAYDAIVSKPAYALRDIQPKTLTPAMLRHINKRVAWLVKNQVGSSYSALGGAILDKFNVNKRENIPLEKYREVCELLGCEPDAKALQGDLLEPAILPAPVVEQAIRKDEILAHVEFNRIRINAVEDLLNGMKRSNEFFKGVLEA
jgi:hypothetical protein